MLPRSLTPRIPNRTGVFNMMPPAVVASGYESAGSSVVI